MRNKVQQLARYYLAELWGDSDFRADWERIKTKLSQDAELAELWQRVQNPDLSPEERMRADCAILWRVKTELSDFCTRWKLPRIIARALENEAATPPETRAFYDRVVPDPAAYELQRLQERIIGEAPTGQVVVIREAEDGGLIATLEPQLPEPPLKCLPEPDPAAETQAQYLARVDWEAAMREYRERFLNLRLSEGALREHVEAIVKGYYNACAERVKPTRYRNREHSEKYLRRLARQVYLRVVKHKTWGEIVDTLFAKELEELSKRRTSEKELREQRENWRVLVIMTTRKACEILGIPSD
jgi:hypothetical protein